MKKNLLKISIAVIFTIGILNNSHAQLQKSPYEIIVDRNGFAGFNGKNYIFVTIFLNNNTNETLYYQGTDCYTSLFNLKRNPYFHLAEDICNNTTYSKLVLPQHRSQRMRIFLKRDKMPNSNVLLNFRMKLYKWVDKESPRQEKDALPGKLSDTIVLHYNSDHQPYWPREEFDILDKKEKSVMPDKDIYLLTDIDRKRYTLTIEQAKISAPRDTVITGFMDRKPKKVSVITVPVTLHNNADDMLRFYSMTCSWNEFWSIDCQYMELPGWACDKNVPEIIEVAPHQEYRKSLNIVYDSKVKHGSLYRISMSLLKADQNIKWAMGLSPDEYVRYNKIWSNAVIIR